MRENGINTLKRKAMWYNEAYNSDYSRKSYTEAVRETVFGTWREQQTNPCKEYLKSLSENLPVDNTVESDLDYQGRKRTLKYKCNGKFYSSMDILSKDIGMSPVTINKYRVGNISKGSFNVRGVHKEFEVEYL